MAIRPNQLHKNDIKGKYNGYYGKNFLINDICEAYDLYNSPNMIPAIDFLFKWHDGNTERIITGFMLMMKMKVIIKNGEN